MSAKRGATAIVLKALGVFGGLQAGSILCSLVRTKLIALWIGPAGVGLFGLYNLAIEMISSLTQLNMRSTAVRDLAAASTPEALGRIITVVKRWAWMLGAAGAFLTLVCAPLLSRATFGDYGHQWGFVWLSVVMLLSSLTGGESAILQGTRQLSRLARGTLWGTVGGTVISIPLYRWLGVESIVPSLIIFSACNLVGILIARSRPAVSPARLSMSETLRSGREFATLGAFMTVSAFATYLASYIFMAWLNREGGEDMTGYFQAGYTLVNRYIGLVFTAIAMEFFPRLASVRGHRIREAVYINHETSIVISMLLPCILLFIGLRSLIVELLYSGRFAVIYDFISWGAVGTVAKAMSWCLAYLIITRGDGRLYLFTELSSAAVYLAVNYLAYKWWGLDGLGVAYLVWYVAYLAVVAVACRVRYRIGLSRRVIFGGIGALVVTSAGVIAAEKCQAAVIAAGVISALIVGRYIIRAFRRRA